MKINLSIKIIGGFISSLILVLIICAFYYNYAKKLKDSILKGEEIQIKINQIERIASLVKDAETGQRGYIITKDESYLTPYKQSLITLDHQMKSLNNGLSDFNETDFELLSLRLKEKLSELSYTIELTKEGNYDSAQAIVLSNKGKIIMDKIRAICSQIENRERNYFEASQKEIEDNWNRSAVWLFIGFTFIIILLILNIFQIVSKVNRNKLLQKEIVLKNKELTEAYKELESHNEEFVALNEELNSNIEELRAANDTISEYSKELELSRDYYTTILHDFPALIWRADTASMCNYFNNSWINFTGRTPEQEYGRGWMEGIHQEDLKTYIDIYEDALSKKQSFVIEYRLRRYDGQNRWVINFGKPLFDINNNFEGYLGACFDIQDKKEFEKEIYAKNQELSQALEELKSTEEHLISLNNNLEERVLDRTRELKEIAENYQMQGSVLESMTEGVSISDELGYIIYTNPAEDQIFGYEKGELIGKHVTVQNTYEPEENERIVNEVIEQLKNKGSWIGEFNNKKKDGTHFTTRARINSIKISEKIYLVCVQEDITEEKKVKDELQEKNKQLVKINADLDNFIYTASHDLKSPISNIEGLTHALNKKLSDKLDDSERKLVQMIEISVNKFKKTISDLTEITKAQKDIEGEIEEVSFKKVLEDVKVDIHELLTQAKDLSIKENIQISNISYQEKNLRSIIYNLLSNSIKYRSSQRPLEISISTYIKEGYKVLEIKDNGLGISSDQLPKIFTMFKRLHTHVEGTGVGLYIVKRMVENNNGKIEVESEIEKGTVFRICFNNA